MRSRGFTIIELVIVIALIAVLFSLVVGGLGISSYWRDETAIRKLSETIEFLHSQAVADQAFYRLQFDMEQERGSALHSYHVGVVRPEEENASALADLCSSETGTLSCELANFLSPSMGSTQTIIPPPNYPSLAEKIYLPEGLVFEDIRTMRGVKSGSERGSSFILFSPRGFSEFGVLHLKTAAQAQITVLINPFSGKTTLYREYRDFEWQYGKKESAMNE
jgi:prepilin-type N-terminal cleavage/methylation domain-containing protein